MFLKMLIYIFVLDKYLINTLLDHLEISPVFFFSLLLEKKNIAKKNLSQTIFCA